MSLNVQRKLIADFTSPKDATSGSFVNNMRLPIHRWFRYSAGFSAEWAHRVVLENCEDSNSLVFDPFAGSGTTLLAADSASVASVGIEAHSFVSRVARAKLMWPVNVSLFADQAKRVLERARCLQETSDDYPVLMQKCFRAETLKDLSRLRSAWEMENGKGSESELVWLAITSIIRSTASAGAIISDCDCDCLLVLRFSTSFLVANEAPAGSPATLLRSECLDLLSFAVFGCELVAEVVTTIRHFFASGESSQS